MLLSVFYRKKHIVKVGGGGWGEGGAICEGWNPRMFRGKIEVGGLHVELWIPFLKKGPFSIFPSPLVPLKCLNEQVCSCFTFTF
jgi:hypothetical protein